MRFNMNYTVRVKLTEVGLRHLGSIEQLWRLLPYTVNTPDADGWSRWQLWDLAATFGPILGNGIKVPFETEIDIPENQS